MGKNKVKNKAKKMRRQLTLPDDGMCEGVFFVEANDLKAVHSWPGIDEGTVTLYRCSRKNLVVLSYFRDFATIVIEAGSIKLALGPCEARQLAEGLLGQLDTMLE